MELPVAPDGMYWEAWREFRLFDWGFTWHRLKEFGDGYMSVTRHIGPFVFINKTRLRSEE